MPTQREIIRLQCRPRCLLCNRLAATTRLAGWFCPKHAAEIDARAARRVEVSERRENEDG